ncbi:hypothetical protein SUGI_0790910 [Cryptomeria japonica]|nr:hypothetical protein SUGI_0790910 [Cryptomeria japonica]
MALVHSIGFVASPKDAKKGTLATKMSSGDFFKPSLGVFSPFLGYKSLRLKPKTLPRVTHDHFWLASTRDFSVFVLLCLKNFVQ